MSIVSRSYILITFLQEIHILKQFDEDFYGSNLKVKVVGFIRPELNFNSVGKFNCYYWNYKTKVVFKFHFFFHIDELVNTIHSDIEHAKQKLDENDKIDVYFDL